MTKVPPGARSLARSVADSPPTQFSASFTGGSSAAISWKFAVCRYSSVTFTVPPKLVRMFSMYFAFGLTVENSDYTPEDIT